MTAGFIYALINPSIDGLIKVGRTNRSTSERARELSSATGVPTPFIVAYERWVEDPIRGEAFVHEQLGRGGYRVNSDREFFRAPLPIVIDAILAFPDSQPAQAPSGSITASDGNTPNLIPLLEQEISDILNGRGKIKGLIDHELALSLCRQWITLGDPDGYKQLGIVYINLFRDGKKAEKAFRDGALAGSYPCLVELASHLDRDGRSLEANPLWDQVCSRMPEFMESTKVRTQRLFPNENEEAHQQRFWGAVDMHLGWPFALHAVNRSSTGKRICAPWTINPWFEFLRQSTLHRLNEWLEETKDEPGLNRRVARAIAAVGA